MDDPRAGLTQLEFEAFPTWHSPGLASRAHDVAARCARAERMLSRTLGVAPEMWLLVLAEGDWEGRAGHPIYGMPNSTRTSIVVAGEPTDFWSAFIELTDEGGRAELARTYGDDGRIDLSGFFDLLAIHEMGHHYERVGRLRTPRLWLREFICNLCLHAYIATEEQERLPELLMFPRVVAGVPAELFSHRTETDFERMYDRMPGPNYGWFQCRMHVGAATVYGSGGVKALRDIWDLYRAPRARLVQQLAQVEPAMGSFAREFTDPDSD